MFPLFFYTYQYKRCWEKVNRKTLYIVFRFLGYTRLGVFGKMMKADEFNGKALSLFEKQKLNVFFTNKKILNNLSKQV